MPKTPPPRLHLIAAKDSPVVVVLRRGPTDRYHAIKYHTDTDRVEHGSWFAGKLYHFRCDLSHDGKRMVYLAMGAKGETWNAICQPPSLEPVALWENQGSWFGGGVWHASNTLALNLEGHPSMPRYKVLKPETVKELEPQNIVYLRHDCQRYGEDEGVLHARLNRDGWQRVLPEGYQENGESDWYVQRKAYWSLRVDQWPEVRLYFREYKSGVGRIFEFVMENHPSFFSPCDSWATFDSIGNLIIARKGRVERWAPSDLESNKPSFSFDLNALPIPKHAHIGWKNPLQRD